jgi:YebC/PmpR family DNA-binding regulatory protein
MSGHSKWATTKHKKAANDAKRGKEFAKLIKNIEVAARTGGGDPSANPTLDDMIKKAKKASVPERPTSRRARKRGSGEEAGGADWETIVYEGYGPNGVAVLVECLTDNRNRATTDVRTAMNKNGGSLADAGSVSYLFNRKGVVILDKGENTEDDLLMAVLDAGAEEVNDLGREVRGRLRALADLTKVRAALEEAGIEYDSADPDYRADVEVPAGRGRCEEDPAPHRRPRGVGRRPGRLHQHGRVRRGVGGARRRVVRGISAQGPGWGPWWGGTGDVSRTDGPTNIRSAPKINEDHSTASDGG